MTTVAWPSSVFAAPLLRGLDQHARTALMAAGRLRHAEADEQLYAEQDVGDTVFVVVEGAVQLRGTRRGDDAEATIRTAGPGDTFGEEASLSLPRRTTARARERCVLAEIPAALFVRGSERSGTSELARREERLLQRTATADLLRTLALTRDLPTVDFDMVLDAIRHEGFERGARIFGAGEPSPDIFLIADGLVQLQAEDDERLGVVAYLGRGDAFGDEDALAGAPRSLSAVAMGPCRLLRLNADVLRTIADRNPGLVCQIRRIEEERGAAQLQVVEGAAAGSTQHVFKDLYRMQMARSLLVIDQDTCIRCGHCAWSCAATHGGTSRLVRRGDKVITQMAGAAQPGVARSLLVPNSCQHCKNPVCMIDCPTGAIGRDPMGEVFIRDALCTGCGNCAKACPWENIQIAPRPAAALNTGGPMASYPDVAVKCDLCRGYEAPACVQSCPTESILRLDPSRDFGEIAKLLGGARSTAEKKKGTSLRPGALLISAIAGATAVAAAFMARLHEAGHLEAGEGWGLNAGIIAAAMMVLLVAYAVPKRVVSLWMRKRRRSSAVRRSAQRDVAPAVPRSKVRPWMLIHIGLGLVAMVAVLAHAGTSFGKPVAGALHLVFWLTAGIGALGGVAYRLVPAALCRIEREGALPEDFAPKRRSLSDRLFRDLSGRSDLVKTIAKRMLLPYAKAPLGGLRLLASGRTIAQERARLRAEIDEMLEHRGKGKLGGVDDLVRTVVELRALTPRRVLTFVLRGWLPVHIVLTGALGVLLAIHAAVMVGRP